MAARRAQHLDKGKDLAVIWRKAGEPCTWRGMRKAVATEQERRSAAAARATPEATAPSADQPISPAAPAALQRGAPSAPPATRPPRRKAPEGAIHKPKKKNYR